MHTPRQSGFTLVEMMITLAVLLTVVGIGLPGFQELIRAHRLRAALSGYSGDFALARISAIGRARQVVVCPSADGRRCVLDSDWRRGWMVFVDADRNLAPDDADAILQVHAPLPEGLDARSTRGRPYLRYLPDGSSVGSNLSLQLCQRQQMRARVVVNNAGRVRIERLNQPLPCSLG